MNLGDYTAHVLTLAMKAYEAGDKEEAVRLLDLLIKTVQEKRDQIAKEL